MWNYTCSRCGARLDPGEICDCEDEEQHFNFQMCNDGQYKFIFGGANENNKDMDKEYC